MNSCVAWVCAEANTLAGGDRIDVVTATGDEAGGLYFDQVRMCVELVGGIQGDMRTRYNLARFLKPDTGCGPAKSNSLPWRGYLPVRVRLPPGHGPAIQIGKASGLQTR